MGSFGELLCNYLYISGLVGVFEKMSFLVISVDFVIYFPMQNLVLIDNQCFNILSVQCRYLFRTNIESKVLISKYSRSNFVMQI